MALGFGFLELLASASLVGLVRSLLLGGLWLLRLLGPPRLALTHKVSADLITRTTEVLADRLWPNLLQLGRLGW